MMVKDGSDITIVACGTMVDVAMDAYALLKKKGVSARIVDMHTIKPLDEELIRKCVKDTGAIITIEEHSVIGGLGGAIAETLAEQCGSDSVAFQRMGIYDMFCESGEPDALLEKYKLNAKHLSKNAVKLLSR